MSATIVVLGGKQFAILPRAEFDRLREKAGIKGDVELPPLAQADKDGTVPAVEYGLASIAREIVKRLWECQLTQTELSARAGVRLETLNRLERGKVMPTPSTVEKVDQALRQVEAVMEKAHKVPSRIGREVRGHRKLSLRTGPRH